jgi:lipopolysaccharide transport system ATP-binding protein
VRLGFAVAAFLEPEILIVDEVLAVGDAEFQKKAIGKMQDVSKGEGRTVLFVSHNLFSLETLCNKGVVLENGNINFIGNISDGINNYRAFFTPLFGGLKWENKNLLNKPIQFKSITIELKENFHLKTLLVSINLLVIDEFLNSFIALYISNKDSLPLIESIPEMLDPISFTQKGEINLIIELNLNGLIPDFYRLGVWIGPSHNMTYDFHTEILNFEIKQSPQVKRVADYPKHAGHFSKKSKITFNEFSKTN